MTQEEKYTLAFEIIKKYGVEKDQDIVVSIAESIKNNRFFVEYSQGKMILFITWHDDIIDGKHKIFLNNLWIEPEYRNRNTLTRLRRVSKYLFKNVDKFYWFNLKKQKLIDRR